MRRRLRIAGMLVMPGWWSLKNGRAATAWALMTLFLASASVVVHDHWLSPGFMSRYTFRTHFDITAGYLGAVDVTPETTFILSVTPDSQSIRRHEAVWPRFPEAYHYQNALLNLAHGIFLGLLLFNVLSVWRRRSDL